MNYICESEKNQGSEVELNLMPMQDADVQKSCADVLGLIKDFSKFRNGTIRYGIKNSSNGMSITIK